MPSENRSAYAGGPAKPGRKPPGQDRQYPARLGNGRATNLATSAHAAGDSPQTIGRLRHHSAWQRALPMAQIAQLDQMFFFAVGAKGGGAFRFSTASRPGPRGGPSVYFATGGWTYPSTLGASISTLPA